MSDTSSQSQTCVSCGNTGTGTFCSNCGQTYAIKRISLKSILHDVFHFFTHLEKGFGYTVKQLVVAPGFMQRQYIDGIRARYQKPFSMFFLSISINALARYLIFHLLARYFHAASDAEADFYHHIQVFIYPPLMPFLAAITWLLFRNDRYNYAETGVIQLYSFSMIFLGVIPIALLKFIWPKLDTAYVELPLIIVYSMITFLRLYTKGNRWVVALKSVVLICAFFFLAQVVEDYAKQFVNTVYGSAH